MSDGLIIRPATADDETAVLSLLQTSMGGGPTGGRSAAFFRWKHVTNPFGSSLQLVAEQPGEGLVGFRTFMRWRFLADDTAVTAMRAVDTATHPAHRGKGIFRRLTLSAVERAAEDTDLIFNTPNDASRPGYLKMGWQSVATVPIAIRPLRPVRVVRGLRRAEQIRGGAPDCRLPPASRVLDHWEAVNDLLGRAADDDGLLRTDAGVAYLRWRYCDPPGLDYRGVAMRDGGRLRGLAIGRARWRGPLAELTLSEVITEPGDDDATRWLLRAMCRGGTDHVTAHLTPGTALVANGIRAGYLPIPGRGPTLVARPLRDDLYVDPTSFANWRLSLGDIEVF